MNINTLKKPFFFSILLLLSFLPTQTFGQTFFDVAPMHGIDKTYGYTVFGGGVSFCDFNGDGWDDLTFATAEDELLVFYVNHEGSFVEIPALVPDLGKAKQVLWVDYDNDGDKDLFVTNFNSPNKLYNNDGDLNLTDVSAASGLSTEAKNTYGATFGDFDNDGWLDLYICNRHSNSLTNELYHNDGTGFFNEVAELTNATDSIRPTFCAAFLDFNADGFQDIYIANDRKLARNTLLKNTGQGNFEDVSVSSNAGVYMDGMNVSAGDYDNDGDQDIYATNTPFDGNILLRNRGNETFEEATSECGVVTNRFCWGANFFDFDNDKDLDLYVCAMNIDSEEPSAFYVNNGTGIFSHKFLQGDSVKSFSNAIGDFNQDGHPDIAINSMAPFPFMLFENRTQNTGHWINIDLEGKESNRDGIGSWIEVFFDGQKVIRYTHCGEGFLAQNSSRIHVGLGMATQVDSIKVRWLSGIVDCLYDLPVDQKIELIEGSTLDTISDLPQKDWSLQPNPAADALWLKSEQDIYQLLSFEIVDAQGRVILNGQTNGSQFIDVSQLVEGVYYFISKSFEEVLPFVVHR